MKRFLLLSTSLIVCTIAQAQTWAEVMKTVASDRAASDYFGYSVSISDTYAIVGASQEDHDTTGGSFLSAAGSAYILERDSNGVWQEVQKLVASDRAASDNFGDVVSISGDYAIVGAHFSDYDTSGANYMSSAGVAYIFERDGSGVWHQAQKLVASDRAANDMFGWSVSISGGHAIVSAYLEDHDESGLNFVNSAGSAYIFERDGSGVWQEVQKIVASDRAANDVFGFDVSISGDYAVVSAYQEDEDEAGNNTLSGAGSAYIFERSGGGTWSEVKKIVPSDRKSQDLFGYSVSISGNHAVVGAYGQDFDAVGADSITSAGAVYFFERSGLGSWSEMQKVVASDRHDTYPFYGIAVNISDSLAIVSAYQDHKNANGLDSLNKAGAAYIYKLDGANKWNEWQKIVPKDRAASDNFAYDVGISGDYLIAGAYQEDEDENGANTLGAAGSAYFFEVCLPTDSTLSVTACDSVVSPSGNYTWTTSNTYMDTIPNAAGCDSVLTINLTITHSTTETINASSCDSLVSPSGNYTWTSSNTYMDTIPNAAGCDSVITVNLTITTPTSATINKTACDSMVSPSGNYTWTTSNTYMDTITNAAGCDSVMTINLTINNATSSTMNITACDSLVSPSGNYTWTASNTYMDTIPNAAGCDSVMTVNLTITTPTSVYLNTMACDSMVSPSGNYTWTTTNTYRDTIPNAAGCDSLMTINLVINSATSSTTNVTACDSLVSPSGNYTWTTSNTYMDTIPNAAGCDSVMTINLTIAPLDTSVTVNVNQVTANLAGASYQWVDCDNAYAALSGETGQTFTATVNGNYAVILMKDGCTDTSSCVNIMTVGVGATNPMASAITVYPNPSTGSFTVRASGEKDVVIMNQLGQVVESFRLGTSTSFAKNISGLPTGVYMVIAVNDQLYDMQRVVVTR